MAFNIYNNTMISIICAMTLFASPMKDAPKQVEKEPMFAIVNDEKIIVPKPSEIRLGKKR